MTRWLRAAMEEDALPTKPTKLTEPHEPPPATWEMEPEVEVLSVLSVLSGTVGPSTEPLGSVHQPLPPLLQADPSPADEDPYRHGRAVNGHPKTWTGRVVRLDEWRALSDWDRHGSTGKRWNGLTRLWEKEGERTEP
jgi:hypothetical protein